MVSWASKPLFSASTLGVPSNASAKASTPSFVRPFASCTPSTHAAITAFVSSRSSGEEWAAVSQSGSPEDISQRRAVHGRFFVKYGLRSCCQMTNVHAACIVSPKSNIANL